MGLSLEMIAALLVALALGSFIGTFADRLAADFRAGGDGSVLRAVGGRSRCLCDERPLSLLELIPLIGFLRRRGRCAVCAAPLPPLEPGVEAAALGGAALILLCGGSAVDAVGLGAATAIAVTLGWIDLDQGFLPDALLMPLALLFVGLSLLADMPAEERAMGAAAGAGLLLGLRWIWLRWRSVEAIGLGDVKLLAIAGFWVGISDLALVILIGAAGTLLFALAATRGRALDGGQTVPFGPGLLAGLMAVTFWRILQS